MIKDREGTANVELSRDQGGYVGTGSAQENSLAQRDETKDRHFAAWQNVIDSKLIEWGFRPEQLEDAELIPPTRLAVMQASKIARFCRNEGFPAPTRVLPDRDGGIVIEHRSGSRVDSLEIDERGKIEWVVLNGYDVINRHEVTLDAD